MKRNQQRAGALAVTLMFLAVLCMPAGASITPETAEFTLAPGASTEEMKTVCIPEMPAKADVLLSFDLTGSMGGVLNTAKSQGNSIISQLDATGVDIQYGVSSHMDYPGYFSGCGYGATYGSASSGDYAYRLGQGMTDNAAAVTSAINALNLGNGADGPEDYTRVLYESYADPATGWRPGAKRVVVHFGDVLTHDCSFGTGPDPGRDAIVGTTDDLTVAMVATGLGENNIMLIECQPDSYYQSYWNPWISATDGKFLITGSSTLVTDVVAAVTEGLSSPTVTGLHIEGETGYEGWVDSAWMYSGPTGVCENDIPVTITVPVGTPAGDYTFKVLTLDADDVSYGEQTVTIHVITNQPPVVEAGENIVGTEGTAVAFSGVYTDEGDAGVHTIEWAFGDGSTAPELETTHIYTDDFSGTATFTVTDEKGAAGEDTVGVTIANVPPAISIVNVPLTPVAVGAVVSASASFTDPGAADTHTALWSWDESVTSAGTVAAGSVTGTHTYTSAGVFQVKVTVTDDDGGSDTETAQTFVVVYDPSAGFVTGGGWIQSPPGAYTAAPTMTGKANFGFVSKYQKGATVPTGQTQFEFHAADFTFHSTTYDWLVIAGTRAQYKGSGTVNGNGDYGFLLTAVDGSPDLFRLKVWDKTTDTIVYDNKLGAADDSNQATAIGGGSIVIHK